MAELVSWLEAGPDPVVDGPVVDGPVVDGPVVDGPVVDGPVVDGPVVDGVVRRRRHDLRARTASAFGVELHEWRVGKYLAALGCRRLSVRPRHPRTDPEAEEAFKKTSPRP